MITSSHHLFLLTAARGCSCCVPAFGVNDGNGIHVASGMADLTDFRMMFLTASLGIGRDAHDLSWPIRARSDAAEAARRHSDHEVPLTLQVLRGQDHRVSTELTTFAFEVPEQVVILDREIAQRVNERYLLVISKRHSVQHRHRAIGRLSRTRRNSERRRIHDRRIDRRRRDASPTQAAAAISSALSTAPRLFAIFICIICNALFNPTAA